MSVEIRKIEPTKKELSKFVKFPIDVLYRDSKCYVPALISDEIATLMPEKNPAFDFCESVYYMAYRDGKPVGRIAGIINRRSELAAMECVGMTRGQLRKLALVECLQYVIIACVGAIVLSLALLAGTQFFLRSIQLIEDNSERLVEFSEPVIRVLIAGAGAFVAALAASLIPLKEMQRTDLVDRIRTLE